MGKLKWRYDLFRILKLVEGRVVIRAKVLRFNMVFFFLKYSIYWRK